jgi:hypothetical protein
MEPSWSKSIENSTICTWFYILAVFNAAFGVAGILAGIYLVSNGYLKSTSLVSLCLGVLIALVNSWFLFLQCNRSLKPSV